MKLSVIILCHNNRSIDRVVSAVAEQTAKDDEIFVVDDFSDVATQDILRKLNGNNIKVLHSDKRGNRSANRNYAANYADGELLVFIDGDVLIEYGALDRIKNYSYDGISGICGNVAAMRMTPETIALTSKRYSRGLQQGEYDFDLWHSAFPDERRHNETLSWNRFYTAFSVIPRSEYIAVGGFDEHFEGWGGEDIDIGYRLSKNGQLKFLSSIRGIHLPHKRNIMQEEKNGRKNMYMMLSKYRNRDMEELLSFALEARAVNALNNVLDTLRKYENSDNAQEPLENELIFNVASREYPNGNIAYLDEKNQRKSESFLGLALPFPDLSFEVAVTTTALLDYPEPLACRILQELLRVCKKVKVKKVLSHNIDWNGIEEKFKYVFCYYKIHIFADSFQDFLIEDCGDYYIIEH